MKIRIDDDFLSDNYAHKVRKMKSYDTDATRSSAAKQKSKQRRNARKAKEAVRVVA